MNNFYKQPLSTDSLIGNKVQNMSGKDIGEIKELMIDTERGTIKYAVMSFGGFMGLGDKYFAVPWSALEIDRENEIYKLDVSKEKLERLDGFDKDNWPNFSDASFEHRIGETYDGIGQFRYQTQ